jgi:hypothetical protein
MDGVAPGPEPPFVCPADAAALLSHCCHSFISQHFRWSDGGRSDERTLGQLIEAASGHMIYFLQHVNR